MSLTLGQVSVVMDRKLISDYLSLDRLWASEAVISLNDEVWPISTWYGYNDGVHMGMALMFKKITPMPVFLTGEPNCIMPIIKSEVMPKEIFVEAPISCVGILKETYLFENALIMNKRKISPIT